jgi:hypothetical protein
VNVVCPVVELGNPACPVLADFFLHPADDNPENTIMLTNRRKSPFNLFSSYHFFILLKLNNF